MAKKESTIVNMVLTLFIITFVASSILGLVNEATKEPIQLAKKKNITEKIQKVVPAFDNNPGDEKYTLPAVDGLGDLTFYPAKKGGELVGVAVETFTMLGFSGKISLMVGMLPDGTIQRIEVLEHNETPGLGDKMDTEKSDFHVQFQGKNPSDFKLSVTKDGGDVDAITASTISSRAYCDAVNRAYETYMKGGKK
ncbi:MAG: FMN-binding domain-containing protein [Marinilabiliales bacterium]|nr:MAG: FMN-binding domain-containing protein [Marinilabiliales bacterium]